MNDTAFTAAKSLGDRMSPGRAADEYRDYLVRYQLEMTKFRSYARTALEDLLAGVDSSFSSDVQAALQDIEGRFPGLADEVRRAGKPSGADSGGKSGGCFVATAVYGSPMAKEVAALRSYRDTVLVSSPFGTALVRLYEIVGPRLASVISPHPWMRALVRSVLLRPILWVIGRRCN